MNHAQNAIILSQKGLWDRQHQTRGADGKEGKDLVFTPNCLALETGVWKCCPTGNRCKKYQCSFASQLVAMVGARIFANKSWCLGQNFKRSEKLIRNYEEKPN